MKELHGGAHVREQERHAEVDGQQSELKSRRNGRGRRVRVPPLIPTERGNTAQLAYAQERLWFLDQLGLVGAAYNMRIALRLTGDLNVAALERSLTELIRRHEILRTRFEPLAGSPIQVIDPAEPYRLRVQDLSDVASSERESRLHRLSAEEVQRSCDLSRGPLFRALLLKMTDSEHVLLMTIHHIIFDGWSRGVLHRELGELYSAYCTGQAPALPELPVQYADFAIWQRAWLQGRSLDKHLEYWREQLRGAPPQLELPTDRPRPAVESFQGSTLRFEIPEAIADAVKGLARREGVTLFMVALAAYQLLLSRWSGQQDIVIGSPIAGRRNRELEGLLGFFVNMLALRTQLDDELTSRQLLARVKDVTLDAYAHEDLPFEVLVKELQPERKLSHQPIFQVVLAMRNFPQEHLELSGLAWNWTVAESGTTHFDITLSLQEHAGGISGAFEYATDLFDETTIQRMAAQLSLLFEAMAAHPDRPLWRLPMLAAAERESVLHAFNDTPLPFAKGELIHQSIEARARQAPDAVALLCGDQQRSYSQLNRRANQVAHALLAQGIRPDDRVALYVERSAELVAGLIGILKAGGAYVPLDVSYPAERLAFMLRDSAPVVLLTQKQLRETVPPGAEQTVVIELDGDEIARQSEDDISAATLGLQAHHLAYIIYTSGSTGVPKGVMIEHRNLMNLVHWHCDAFNVDARSRCSSVAAIGFDAATWEIWPPLSVGATLILAPPDATCHPDALLKWWAGQSLDISFLPTPVAEIALSRNIGNKRLRTLLVGGDRLRHRPDALPFALINNYGPTESTVVATSGRVDERDAVLHIGQPIANTQIYILDRHLQPVAIGVPGEICISGANIARGYLNRPALSAERFLPDPFSQDPAARIYRTGDLGRWRTDGTIEYLGRNDHQVKVRGYRIEIGEIEAQLLGHSHVKDAAVVAHETLGEKRLAAYVVPDLSAAKTFQDDSDSSDAEVVAHWEGLYEETYSAGPVGPSFVGWNSSYTGERIPDAEMQEWVDCTVARIQALRPEKILEIGCGVGLLLQHLAPRCPVYVGVDISASALDQLRQWMGKRAEFTHVKLRRGAATELQDLPDGAFDTVVINSVMQYFPSIDYLLDVLQEAARLVGAGGRIFLGDVRDLRSLPMFQSSVQLTKAAATVRAGQLRGRIAKAIEQDKELLIDPRLFDALLGRIPGISAVEVQAKRGQASNELTRHRYDVVLHTGTYVSERLDYEQLQWGIDIRSSDELRTSLLEHRLVAARVASIPNGRLIRETVAQELIETADERIEVNALRRELSELQVDALDPETLWEWAEAYGYEVLVQPGTPGCLDVQLLDRARADEVQKVPSAASSATRPWSEYANDPLAISFRQQLIPRLREHLQRQLPDYMVPTTWSVLEQLPLTPNGKLDRRALPAPQSRPDDLGEYVAPGTPLERTLAEIWAEVLRVDQVGVADNFFDLGGHSLLVVKALFKINQALQSSLVATDVYKSPTIRELAARITEGASADELVDLAREAVLDEDIVAIQGERRSRPAAVLLTGATGFVGRFLLAQLLTDTDATIYCVVRAKPPHQALSRLRTTLLDWDLWRDEWQRRIVAIPGDLRLPRLGIDDATYDRLSQDVDSIYHCATSMNHLETYAMARLANVESARQLLKLATRHRPKVINYISTLGIFAPSAEGQQRVVDESTRIDREKHATSRGYIASKWVGENIFNTATQRGIPCNIFRLGLVWADTFQGRFDELQNAYRVLKSCLASGYGIKGYRYPMAPTPVDYVARAITFLSNSHWNGGGVFHIAAPEQPLSGIFERCNEIAGTSLELLSHYDWIAQMKRLRQAGMSLPVVPLIESAVAMDEDAFNEYQRRSLSAAVRFDCSRTHRELEQAGIVAPTLNDDLLKLCVAEMLSRDVELQELPEATASWQLQAAAQASGDEARL